MPSRERERERDSNGSSRCARMRDWSHGLPPPGHFCRLFAPCMATATWSTALLAAAALHGTSNDYFNVLLPLLSFDFTKARCSNFKVVETIPEKQFEETTTNANTVQYPQQLHTGYVEFILQSRLLLLRNHRNERRASFVQRASCAEKRSSSSSFFQASSGASQRGLQRHVEPRFGVENHDVRGVLEQRFAR